jgi:hypothetical protein
VTVQDAHMMAITVKALAGLSLLALFGCGVIAGLRVLFGLVKPGPLPWVLMGIMLVLCGPYITAIGHPLPALIAASIGVTMFALALLLWDRKKGGQR